MALSHHVVVWVAARRCKAQEPFIEYALLGDDIVIWNAKVAKEYQKIMELELGVSISKEKSLTSKYSAEFAKTLCWRGLDVSPLPLKLMKAIKDYPNVLPMFVKDTRKFRDGKRISIRDLSRIVPRNKYWNALLLMTCPLYSESKIWGIDRHSM